MEKNKSSQQNNVEKKVYDVFVSYRRERLETARSLVQALEKRGLRVFFDLEELDDGDFNEELYDAIDQSKNAIFLMTEGALDGCAREGDWVRNELEHVLQKEIKLILVNPSDVTVSFPDTLPQSLQKIKKIQVTKLDLGTLFNDSVNKIVKRLEGVRLAGQKVDDAIPVLGNAVMNDNNHPHDIFISYSRKNKDAVLPIKDEIEQLGLTCWIDLSDISCGADSFKKRVIPGIRQTRVASLFFLSAESQSSEYAMKEINFAKKRAKKRVILVRFNDDEMTDDFFFDFQDADIIDWRVPEQKEKLLRDLGAWSGNGGQSAAPAREEVRRKAREKPPGNRFGQLSLGGPIDEDEVDERETEARFEDATPEEEAEAEAAEAEARDLDIDMVMMDALEVEEHSLADLMDLHADPAFPPQDWEEAFRLYRLFDEPCIAPRGPFIPQKQDVVASTFSPSQMRKNSNLLVSVFLHTRTDAEYIKLLAREIHKDAERRSYKPLACQLKEGDRVDVSLNIYGGNKLLLSQAKSITWQGVHDSCTFRYFITEDFPMDEICCEVNLSLNNVPIGEMLFIVKIGEDEDATPAEFGSREYKKIFISYSHEDVAKVKYIADAYKLEGKEYFFDRHYLKSGDVYPEEISNFINTSDLFILCWSANASKSEYVRKELSQALNLAYPKIQPRGKARLTIRPISIDPRADPPAEMKDIYNFEEF